MEMKISDLLDRWTILLMKARVDEGARDELERYDKEVTGVLVELVPAVDVDALVRALVALMEANAKTWAAEAAVRNECPRDPAAGGPPPDLREIGRRALEIRAYNRLRCEAKAKIDALYGDVPDRKVDHASE